MAITEEERHRMYQRLEEVLGREQAATLMEHLPPVGWADVATKRDLDHLEHRLRGDIGQLRGELGHLDQSLRGELAHVDQSLRGEIGRMGDQLRAEWRHDLLLATFAMIAANVALLGAAVAVLRPG